MASIRQYRGKTWRAIIRRVGKPTQTKTFKTKREAELWVAGIESGKTFEAHGVVDQVCHVFERYETEVAANMRGRNEATTVKRLIRDAAFMDIRIDKISPEDIRDWRDMRVREVKPATVHREMNTISAVFTHAMKEWSAPLTVNPCHLVSRFKNADKPRNKQWTDDDVKALLDASGWHQSDDPKTGRDYVGWALLIALETAMRIGEMCRIKVSDFYPEQKRIHLSITKNGDSRDVPLSPNAVGYITHLCKGRKPDDKIIPLTADTLGEYMFDARQKAGLGHLVTHDARHTAATQMSKKLSNVLELAAVTGHKSLRHLQRYYHPSAASIADKLG